MKLTTLFRLRKPDGTDPVNIEDFNDNFDVIDEELGKRLESTGAASDMTVAFEQASTRTNLKTGEKISVSFGKIMKWFADLKTVAFSGSYSDLSNKPSIPSGAAASQAVANNCTTTAAGSVLDARQGKVLMDKANQLSSDMETQIAGITLRHYVGEVEYVSGRGEISLSALIDFPYNSLIGVTATVQDTSRTTYVRAAVVSYEAQKIIIAVSDYDNALPTAKIWTSVLLFGTVF